jgi:hypothetical protein
MYRRAKLCVLVQFRGEGAGGAYLPPCFFHKPVGQRRRRVTGWRMIGETRSTDRSNDGDSKQPASSDRDSFRHATPRPSRARLSSPSFHTQRLRFCEAGGSLWRTAAGRRRERRRRITFPSSSVNKAPGVVLPGHLPSRHANPLRKPPSPDRAEGGDRSTAAVNVVIASQSPEVQHPCERCSPRQSTGRKHGKHVVSSWLFGTGRQIIQLGCSRLDKRLTSR